MPRLVACLLVACFAANAAEAQPYEVVYDPATGELTLVTYGPMINFVIESSTVFFLNPGAGFNLLGGTPVYVANTISGSNPFAALPAGSYSLGQQFEPGLSEQQFLEAVTPFSASGNLYTTGLGEPKMPFTMVYLPEPSSLAMLGLGALLVVRWRRDRV